jgi:hypothetical protein
MHYGENMLFTDVYSGFSWLLVATTACLFFLPRHRKSINKVVPYANTYLALIRIMSLVLGMLIPSSILFLRYGLLNMLFESQSNALLKMDSLDRQPSISIVC